MAIEDPITSAVELALLNEWFATVVFDKESTGLPAMEPEEDDEARSVLHGALIQGWFEDMTKPIPRHEAMRYGFAHQDSRAWDHVDFAHIGMSRSTAFDIIARETSFRELFGETEELRRKKGFNPYRDKEGKFSSKPDGGGGTKLLDKLDDKDKGKPTGQDGKLSDADFAERSELVSTVIGNAFKNKTTTDKTEVLPGGAWKPERDKLHREIADDLYERASNVPNEGKALIAGGLGGAGKTTVLTKFAGVDTSKYLTINPDDIKEELAKRNVIPELPDAPNLSPMERAALVHEESSRIAHMVAAKAYQDRKNVIWDITMSSESSVRSRMSALKKAGYGDVGGVFVDIPVEVSVNRAMGRYRSGVDKYLEGKGYGGRYVPPAIIRAQKTSSGETINRQVFDTLRSDFDSWSVYDNSVDGRAPQLVVKSGGVS